MHPGRLTGPKAHRSETSDARSEGCATPELVNSTKKAARIAQNLRADKRIGVGAHLGAASPINGIGLPSLHPSGTRIRCDSLGMIRTLVLVRPIGIGRRGEEYGETHSGNEQSSAEMCLLDPGHGRTPPVEDVARANMAPLGDSGQPACITNWCRPCHPLPSGTSRAPARGNSRSQSRLRAIASLLPTLHFPPGSALRPAAAP